MNNMDNIVKLADDKVRANTTTRAFKVAWDAIFVHQYAGYLSTDEIIGLLDSTIGAYAQNDPTSQSLQYAYADVRKLPTTRFQPLRYTAVRKLSLCFSDVNKPPVFISRIEGKRPYNGEMVNLLHDYREHNNYWEDEIPAKVVKRIRKSLREGGIMIDGLP